jgi:hypothetical protein
MANQTDSMTARQTADKQTAGQTDGQQYADQRWAFFVFMEKTPFFCK